MKKDKKLPAELFIGNKVFGAEILRIEKQYAVLLCPSCETEFRHNLRDLSKKISNISGKIRTTEMKCCSCLPAQNIEGHPKLKIVGKGIGPRTETAREATQLLKEGRSYSYIRDKLNVATSTIDVWNIRWVLLPKSLERIKELEQRVKELENELFLKTRVYG